MCLTKNGNDWCYEDLEVLVLYYDKVKLCHLCKLIPNQCEFDIVRKAKELKAWGITTVEELRKGMKA